MWEESKLASYYIYYTDYGKLPILQKKQWNCWLYEKSKIFTDYSKSADFAAHFVKSADLSKQADTFCRI